MTGLINLPVNCLVGMLAQLDFGWMSLKSQFCPFLGYEILSQLCISTACVAERTRAFYPFRLGDCQYGKK